MVKLKYVIRCLSVTDSFEENFISIHISPSFYIKPKSNFIKFLKSCLHPIKMYLLFETFLDAFIGGKGRAHLGDQDVDGRIILKMDFHEIICERCNEPLGFINKMGIY